eukprot:s2326_g10.t1
MMVCLYDDDDHDDDDMLVATLMLTLRMLMMMMMMMQDGADSGVAFGYSSTGRKAVVICSTGIFAMGVFVDIFTWCAAHLLRRS